MEPPEKCTACDGFGTFYEDVDDPENDRELTCPLCKGTTYMKVEGGKWVQATNEDWDAWLARPLPEKPESVVPYGELATARGETGPKNLSAVETSLRKVYR